MAKGWAGRVAVVPGANGLAYVPGEVLVNVDNPARPGTGDQDPGRGDQRATASNSPRDCSRYLKAGSRRLRACAVEARRHPGHGAAAAGCGPRGPAQSRVLRRRRAWPVVGGAGRPRLRAPGLRSPGLRAPGLRSPGLRSPGLWASGVRARQPGDRGFSAGRCLRGGRVPGGGLLRQQPLPLRAAPGQRRASCIPSPMYARAVFSDAHGLRYELNGRPPQQRAAALPHPRSGLRQPGMGDPGRRPGGDHRHGLADTPQATWPRRGRTPTANADDPSGGTS